MSESFKSGSVRGGGEQSPLPTSIGKSTGVGERDEEQPVEVQG